MCLSYVSAECPNGCSGNGDCLAKDMCQCYKNYQGNDCADRTCMFGYAHVDTPRGDINMDQDRRTSGWILANSQQHPAQTYEYFNPSAKTGEAHFYLECSNKGICDRSTGLCQCFDGYEGNGCRRTVCPSKCGGHGTCESIRELGVKNGGTLFGPENAAGPVAYDFWDANKTYGCRCDPGFFGPDCSKRTCKVGVDPLFLSSGTADFETWVLQVYHVTASANFGANSWVRLRIFDFSGEMYITQPITVLDDSVTGNPALNAAAVTAAIKALPNLAFRDVTCEPMGAGPNLSGYKSLRETASVTGMTVVCQYNDNAGKMRIPEIQSFSLDTIVAADQRAFVGTTAQQGHNTEWFTVQTPFTVTSVDGTGLVLTVAGGDPTGMIPAAQLIKIGPHIVLALSATSTTITLAFPLRHTLPTAAPIFSTISSTGASSFTLTAGTALGAALAVGSDVLTFAGTLPSYNVGDLIFLENAMYSVQAITLTSGVYYAKIDKPFGGNSDTGGPSAAASVAYVITKPTDQSSWYTYVSECSGRGMCGYDTGICTCFKGYTNDNCNTQNILAL